MSLDPTEPFAPSNTKRDWFFPSSSCIYSSPSPSKTLKTPRRFSTNSRISKPYLSDSRSQKTSTYQSFSSNSIPRRDSKYAGGIRRRIDFAHRSEKTQRAEGSDVVSANSYVPEMGGSVKKKAIHERFNALLGPVQWKVRWQLPLSAAVSQSTIFV